MRGLNIRGQATKKAESTKVKNKLKVPPKVFVQSNEQAEAENKQALKKSKQQAKKELAKEYVQKNMEEVTEHPLWNLPGSVSPMAAENLVVKGVGLGVKALKGVPKAIKAIPKKFVTKEAQKLLMKSVKKELSWLDSPEGKRRAVFNNIDAEKAKKQFRAIRYSTEPEGSSYSNSRLYPKEANTINYDRAQKKSLENRLGLSKEDVIEHELGHFYQSKDIKIKKDYTEDMMKAGKEGVTNYSSILQGVSALDLDKAFTGIKVKGGLEGDPLLAFKYFASGSRNGAGIPSPDLNQRALERTPFLREYRSSLLDHKILPDRKAKLTDKAIDTFLKQNPKNRLNSFVDFSHKPTREQFKNLYNNLLTTGAVGGINEIASKK